MSVTTGQVHNYCGMTLIFDNNSVKVDMKEYLKNTINEFPEDCSKTVTTPAAIHLFEVNNNQTKLDKKMKQIFHMYAAKMLFGVIQVERLLWGKEVFFVLHANKRSTRGVLPKQS